MRITIHRRGGYAGTEEVLAVLDAAERTAAPDLLRQLGALLPRERPAGADFQRYEILVEDAAAAAPRSLAFADDGSDPAQKLVELVNRLVALGKKPA